jgi:hypothetical protein
MEDFYMKKLFNHVKNYGATMINRTKAVLACNRAEGFVDTAVKILIAVVIGALVLAGLYLLFSGTILPTLTQRIQDMFNYGG